MRSRDAMLEEAAHCLSLAKMAKRLKRPPEVIFGWMEAGAFCLTLANGHDGGARPSCLPPPAYLEEAHP